MTLRIAAVLFGVALAAGAALGGCAAAGSQAELTPQPGLRPDTAELRRADALMAEQRRLAEKLAGGLHASASPDCERARELADAICRLADRICAIARRHPHDGELEKRCHDARQRCESGRARLAVRCPAGVE